MKPLECRSERHKMRFRIRERLDRQGLNMLEIARRIGVNKNLVRDTISGFRNNNRVLIALRDDFGIPEELLFMPSKDKA
ncbi:hypothetical protein SAMN04488503_0222 [Humidesulfovibrio mexicanus]|uniref:HTH cro/C1-type domain-containing protein n=1 Tax=Humidesulfovibrio mexicanus TaxID=147047 RepID=A0A238XLA6_9BACT|nr:hypothetical protein [Humidesulfovibrio mexicanus]SNR59361.1 hypothetical protein SAMN04488503_0222 [Humidesulfovibrio mexicanus]